MIRSLFLNFILEVKPYQHLDIRHYRKQKVKRKKRENV